MSHNYGRGTGPDGREGWLAGVRDDLVAKMYKLQPVRRVMIPKPGGGERPLGIPTIGDRVVQTAAKLVLEPIFDADLDPNAYGYRPGRGGADAVKDVHRLPPVRDARRECFDFLGYAFGPHRYDR